MNERKTAREWFEELPPRLCKLAKDNTTNNWKTPRKLDEEYDSVRDALLFSFVWQKTKHNFSFWNDIDHALATNGDLLTFENQLGEEDYSE